MGRARVPRFSLGGTFEILDIEALLSSTEPFTPPRLFRRRTIDGRRRGRVGVRSFRVALRSALLLPAPHGPCMLGETVAGDAYFGPLPPCFEERWWTPQSLELFVCGRVIEGWAPRGQLAAPRAPLDTATGYPSSMVATLGPAFLLPRTLQRWWRHRQCA